MSDQNDNPDVAAESELPDENPPPSDPDYISVLITANQSEAERIAGLFRSNALRVNETVWNEIGIPEYVVEVHKDDSERANGIFWNDAGPPIASATSSNAEQEDASDG